MATVTALAIGAVAAIGAIVTMTDQSDKTTIEIHRSTWRRLNAVKEPGDSFDDALNRVLNIYLEHRGEHLTPVTLEDLEPEVDESAQQAAVAGVDGLSLPGSGEVLERRREAVRAVVERVHELGRAAKPELLEIVDPESLGYQDAESCWKGLLQSALHNIDEVEASGPGGYWMPTEAARADAR